MEVQNLPDLQTAVASTLAARPSQHHWHARRQGEHDGREGADRSERAGHARRHHGVKLYAPHCRSQRSDSESNRCTQTSPAGATASYARTERTSLSIRTQEGDVVKLKFRVQQSLTLDARQGTDGETLVSNVDIGAASRTRLAISVEGDLNEAELAAIQDVIDQTSTLAQEFFTGGVTNAFATAQDLSADGQVLARVSLKLGVRERFSMSAPALPAPALAVPRPATVDSRPEAVPSAATNAPATQNANPEAATETAAAEASEPAAPDEVGTNQLASEPPSEGAPSAGSDLPMSWTDALQTISSFLHQLLAALDAAGPAEPTAPADAAAGDSGVGSSTLRFRVDTSLKLQVFKTIVWSAAEETAPVPDVVAETLDALAAESTPPLDVSA